MIYQIFTVHDQKAGAYLPPFYFTTKGQAIRAFADTCNDPAHAFSKHPEDYTLFDLGTYDDGTAGFNPHVTPISLGTALEHRQETEILHMPELPTNSRGAEQ